MGLPRLNDALHLKNKNNPNKKVVDEFQRAVFAARFKPRDLTLNTKQVKRILSKHFERPVAASVIKDETIPLIIFDLCLVAGVKPPANVKRTVNKIKARPDVDDRVQVNFPEDSRWNGVGVVHSFDGLIYQVRMETGLQTGQIGGFRIAQLTKVKPEPPR